LENRPIPLETFKDNKDLGRIMLRKGGETVAAGVVTQVWKTNYFCSLDVSIGTPFIKIHSTQHRFLRLAHK
jgi:hypothetical protein